MLPADQPPWPSRYNCHQAQWHISINLCQLSLLASSNIGCAAALFVTAHAKQVAPTTQTHKQSRCTRNRPAHTLHQCKPGCVAGVHAGLLPLTVQSNQECPCRLTKQSPPGKAKVAHVVVEAQFVWVACITPHHTPATCCLVLFNSPQQCNCCVVATAANNTDTKWKMSA